MLFGYPKDKDFFKLQTQNREIKRKNIVSGPVQLVKCFQFVRVSE